MTLPAFVTAPWWLCVGAACALVMAVSAYRSRTFDSAPANVGVWDEAIARTAHAITIAVIIGFTIAAWPFVVVAQVINLWRIHRESIENDMLDRSEW